MNTNSNSYVMAFSIGLCVTVSSILAVLATQLEETQLAAAEFDRQKNVMMAAGLIERGDPRSRADPPALPRCHRGDAARRPPTSTQNRA